MFVRVHAHEEWELLKWMILLTLAGALTCAFAASTAGAHELRPPAGESDALAGDIAELAAPMKLEEQKSPAVGEDVSWKVWQALDAQYREDFDGAVALWQAIELPSETEVWKHVALAQAFLATIEVEKAEAALTLAAEVDARNAMVHYCFGIVRLQRAYVAEQWNDVRSSKTMAYVSNSPMDVVPNTKSMYLLNAMMDLTTAIELAPELNLHQSLVPDDWPTRAAAPPTVNDLLLATRAEKFSANAHNVLGNLHLDRGALEQAEHHMDAAVSSGLSAVYGYSDLAKAYENAGQHADAMRAYMKAAQDEPGKVAPLRGAWKNFLKSIF